MDVRLEALSLHFDGNLEGVYTSAKFSSLRLLYDQSPFFLDMRLQSLLQSRFSPNYLLCFKIFKLSQAFFGEGFKSGWVPTR